MFYLFSACFYPFRCSAVEQAIFARIDDLSHHADTVTFYDLINTCFERTATQNGQPSEGTPRKSARIASCATGFTTGKTP